MQNIKIIIGDGYEFRACQSGERVEISALWRLGDPYPAAWLDYDLEEGQSLEDVVQAVKTAFIECGYCDEEGAPLPRVDVELCALEILDPIQ